MKILFYIRTMSGGGAERVMSTLLERLSKNEKYELVLATSSNATIAYKIPNSVKIQNLTKGCDLHTKSKFEQLVKYTIPFHRNIRNIAKREKPDVIVVFMGNCISNVILMIQGLHIPVIGSEHTNVSRSFGKLFELKRNMFYPLASAITVLTNYDYDLWKKKFSNVVRMPNPSDFKRTENAGQRKKRILAVGRVADWNIKGYDNLLKAWAKICNKYPDWKLVFVGKSDEKADKFLSNFIEDNKCSNVEFLGFRKDVNKLLCESEIFCLSSRVEGLPMGLIEAMKAGCCCVAFDVKTGPREIIKDYYSGLLVKNQSIDDLAEKLDSVIASKELREYLALHSSETVVQYSTEAVINEWEHLFNNVIKQ